MAWSRDTLERLADQDETLHQDANFAAAYVAMARYQLLTHEAQPDEAELRQDLDMTLAGLSPDGVPQDAANDPVLSALQAWAETQPKPENAPARQPAADPTSPGQTQDDDEPEQGM